MLQLPKCWVLRKASFSRSFIYPRSVPLDYFYLLFSAAGKGLKLGGTAQAPGGGALLKPGGASLPSRPLGGGAQGPGLPRGSLKSSAATEKEDDGFDADDWFKVSERVL